MDVFLKDHVCEAVVDFMRVYHGCDERTAHTVGAKAMRAYIGLRVPTEEEANTSRIAVRDAWDLAHRPGRPATMTDYILAVQAAENIPEAVNPPPCQAS